jgi:scyllo-inositol 2-dehydrogenase (NADP+)
MTPPVRVALVGYGLAGSVFHGPLLAATPDLTLAAVVTGNPQRQADARAAHPGVEIVPTTTELWPRVDSLDLVVVASPNTTHVPVGLAALEHGLAVVVDKPLAVTSAEGARLVDAARSASRLLTVFQNRRWDGDVLTLRRLMDGGVLGRVHRFESRFERWRPQPRTGSWREAGSPAEGAGVLLDLGSHVVDQTIWLFGPPARVYAEVRARRTGMTADDDAFLALTVDEDVQAHLSVGMLAAAPGPRLRVLGDRAAYVKDGLDVQEEQLRSGLRPGDDGFGVEPAERWGRLVAGEESSPVPTLPGGYADFYPAVVRALRSGDPPPVDPEDALAVLRVLEAARRSSEQGGVITIA